MRTFYLFKIKKTYYNLTKESPYNLYQALENIYHLKKEELKNAYLFFDQIKENFNKDRLDRNLYNAFKEKYTYTNFNYTHLINDYYTDEKTKLIINKTYLYIKSTKEIPIFLKVLSKKDNIFVCDFNNRDYFWLGDI